jgi:sulfur carrier protein
MTTTETQPRDIAVNGTAVASRAETLAALVDEQGFAGIKVATAINGDFVPERQRLTTPITPGDRIEILSVRQGG